VGGQNRTLPLFARPTSDEAWKLVQRVPLGSRLAKEPRKSKGRRYEYWFAHVKQGKGRPKRVYVGDEDAKRRLELAWAVVGEELAAAERSPEVQRLRRLEARAGKLARTAAANIVEVPMRGVAGPK
jgi:hypothetical protein